jgi:ribulose-5-phosphate 4-epimerase/fuculose-1-phosphate aldolase
VIWSTLLPLVRSDSCLCAPSQWSETDSSLALTGVLKERIKPEDIFILRLSDRQPVYHPAETSLRISACTPLFYTAYKIRSAGACIHGHSQASVLVSLLWEGETFEIANQEQIKGVRRGGMGKAWDNTDTLVIPIIDNKPYEQDLEEDMETARSLIRACRLFQLTLTPGLAKIPRRVGFFLSL